MFDSIPYKHPRFVDVTLVDAANTPLALEYTTILGVRPVTSAAVCLCAVGVKLPGFPNTPLQGTNSAFFTEALLRSEIFTLSSKLLYIQEKTVINSINLEEQYQVH